MLRLALSCSRLDRLRQPCRPHVSTFPVMAPMLTSFLLVFTDFIGMSVWSSSRYGWIASIVQEFYSSFLKREARLPTSILVARLLSKDPADVWVRVGRAGLRQPCRWATMVLSMTISYIQTWLPPSFQLVCIIRTSLEASLRR